MKKTLVSAFTFLMLAGIAPQAQALTVVDEYWGGNVGAGGFNEDTIGGLPFAVDSLVAERTGTDLMVTINTNYVNNIGNAGTVMGSLMIGTGAVNFAGTGPNYINDTYVADPSRFSYVFDYDIANSAVTGGSGTGKLYSFSGVANAQLTTVRTEQTFDRVDGSGTDTGVVGTWSIAQGPALGSVTFKIMDIFSVAGIDSTSLILSWTMSCGNDVVIGSALDFGKVDVAETPIPAAALLLLSGIGGLGYAGRRKKA